LREDEKFQRYKEKFRKNISELEDTQNHVMIVFKYITEKDVFQKFYNKVLAKRLVFYMSASDKLA
jgi:hypothetical protein